MSKLFVDDELQALALEVAKADRKAELLCEQRNALLTQAEELKPMLQDARNDRQEANSKLWNAVHNKIDALAGDPLVDALLRARKDTNRVYDEDDL